MNATEGIRYTDSLSYLAISKSDLSVKEKRDMAYSVYNFGLLYQTGEMTNPDPKLFELKACYTIDKNEHPEYEQKKEYIDGLNDGDFVTGGGVMINGKIKFDAGGNLWKKCVEKGMLIGDDALAPEKLPLYTLIYKIISLSTAADELIAMWYVHFPFVVNLGAPYEEDPFMNMKAIVLKENIFEKALSSRYSDIVYVNTKEMVLGGVNPILIDWFIEYTEWKNQKNEKGISRETEKYQRELALGNFEYAAKGTDRLLNEYPDDEEIYLLNIAARTSQAGEIKEEKVRERMHDGIIIDAQEALQSPRFNKKNYVAYYLGLAFLGKNEVEKAQNCFRLALTYDPQFELATFMLKGIDKLINKN